MRVTMSLILLALSPTVVLGQADEPILRLNGDGHSDKIRRILFTKKHLITVSFDKTIRIRDRTTTQTLRVLRPPVGHGENGLLLGAALSPDEKTLAVSGVSVPEPQKGKIYLISLERFEIDSILLGHTDETGGLSFSPDAKLLASCSRDGTVRIWDVKRGVQKHTLVGHTDHPSGAVFSPDGSKLLTGCFDKIARIYSVETGRLITKLEGHTGQILGLDWSPDGRTLVTAGGRDKTIRLWSNTGRLLRRFPQDNGVLGVQFSPDSRNLLFGRMPVDSRDCSCSIISATSGEELTRFRLHKNLINALTFSPDGKLVASSDSNQKTYFWNAKTAKVVREIHSPGQIKWAVGWKKDSKSVAWGSTRIGNDHFDRPLEKSFHLSNLKLTSIASGRGFDRARRTVDGIVLSRHQSNPKNTLGFFRKSDGALQSFFRVPSQHDKIASWSWLGSRQAAAGTLDAALYLFDSKSGNVKTKFLGHTGVIWDTAGSPDSKYLATASADQTVRIWTPNQKLPLLSLYSSGNEWIAWTPEGYYAASPGGEKLMGWHVNNGFDRLGTFHPAERFRNALYKPDVIRKLLQAGSTRAALRLAGERLDSPEVTEILPPKAKIISHQTGDEFRKPKQTVKVRVESQGKFPITAVRLYLDGRPWNGADGTIRFDPPKRGQVEVSWNVEFTKPGEVELMARAQTQMSQGASDSEVVYFDAPQLKVEPRLHVLAIGVADYDESKLRLHYSAKDADALSKRLASLSAPKPYENVVVETLKDKEATRQRILESLTRLHQKAKENDWVIVYFSGHGHRENKNLYLLPVDADLKRVPQSAVSSRQLTETLVRIPGQVLVMLDACHSGAVMSEVAGDITRELGHEQNGLIVFCSSRGQEKSVEDNASRRSIFTDAILKAIAGEQGNFGPFDYVYDHDVTGYVIGQVMKATDGDQVPNVNRPGNLRPFPISHPHGR